MSPTRSVPPQDKQSLQFDDNSNSFDEHEVLHQLKHYLPAQAPLKDFVHHNTLHAFQNLKFYKALHNASAIFGYKVSLTLKEYRELYDKFTIREDVLDAVIERRKGKQNLAEWKLNTISKHYETEIIPRIGNIRSAWKKYFHMDLDSLVHPKLFRILCNYLDQGITMWNFPVHGKGFYDSIRELEKNSFVSFFNTPRAKRLLQDEKTTMKDLLHILVGEESFYKNYLFDQQFAHQGWSGMVSSIEDFPQNLLDSRNITLHDLVMLELLLEIDALDFTFHEIWSPLAFKINDKPADLLRDVQESELHEVFTIWQEAFEWSYYDEVLEGIKDNWRGESTEEKVPEFQAFFCIDDRECSTRRYLEHFAPECKTYATPGFFGVEFFYQPENGKFYTKLCPAPVTPKYLIKEQGSKFKRGVDIHFHSHSHSLLRGWIISQTLGFWSAFRLFLNIFNPTMTPAAASSLKHMDKFSSLTIMNDRKQEKENGLQIGFKVEEMVTRVEGVLKSTGAVKNFAPVVYVIGHGSSSVNNPHYAAYDCGACCGRPGSVNARVFCYMANNKEVRQKLSERGIDIPESTEFVGGLHDTTRDEISFYDEQSLTPANKERHEKNLVAFRKTMDANAKERSRRFVSINSKLPAEKIHRKIIKRSVSFFEPRPEYNHATNALCVIGRRSMTDNLFLDRRAFMNSYDYKIDPEGKFLLNILKAAAPVCGGINLEYFFSRVDNQKLGAGSKLPHNVMGLFGVSNGSEGDLRPGLPAQMVEIHDPVRLLTIVEHYPEVILQTIQRAPETYEWFKNEWIHLVAVHPETRAFYLFKDEGFVPYVPMKKATPVVDDLAALLEMEAEKMHVYLLNK
jgi:uncharacterized protein